MGGLWSDLRQAGLGLGSEVVSSLLLKPRLIKKAEESEMRKASALAILKGLPTTPAGSEHEVAQQTLAKLGVNLPLMNVETPVPQTREQYQERRPNLTLPLQFTPPPRMEQRPQVVGLGPGSYDEVLARLATKEGKGFEEVAASKRNDQLLQIMAAAALQDRKANTIPASTQAQIDAANKRTTDTIAATGVRQDKAIEALSGVRGETEEAKAKHNFLSLIDSINLAGPEDKDRLKTTFNLELKRLKEAGKSTYGHQPYTKKYVYGGDPVFGLFGRELKIPIHEHDAVVRALNNPSIPSDAKKKLLDAYRSK